MSLAFATDEQLAEQVTAVQHDLERRGLSAPAAPLAVIARILMHR